MRPTGRAMILGSCLWLLGITAVEALPAKFHHQPRLPQKHDSIAPDVKAHSKGEVSFETLRMLSTGMTKAEVLSKAGAPRHSFQNRGTQRWVYAGPDRWIVEVVFSGNNVISVDWSRT